MPYTYLNCNCVIICVFICLLASLTSALPRVVSAGNMSCVCYAYWLGSGTLYVQPKKGVRNMFLQVMNYVYQALCYKESRVSQNSMTSKN
jgi:hypothetical protein